MYLRICCRSVPYNVRYVLYGKDARYEPVVLLLAGDVDGDEDPGGLTVYDSLESLDVDPLLVDLVEYVEK